MESPAKNKKTFQLTHKTRMNMYQDKKKISSKKSETETK